MRPDNTGATIPEEIPIKFTTPIAVPMASGLLLATSSPDPRQEDGLHCWFSSGTKKQKGQGQPQKRLGVGDEEQACSRQGKEDEGEGAPPYPVGDPAHEDTHRDGRQDKDGCK